MLDGVAHAQNRELFAADACDVGFRVEPEREHLRDPAQRLVAILVEGTRIEIADEQCEGLAGREAPVDRELERARVRQPRDEVALRENLQFGVRRAVVRREPAEQRPDGDVVDEPDRRRDREDLARRQRVVEQDADRVQPGRQTTGCRAPGRPECERDECDREVVEVPDPEPGVLEQQERDEDHDVDRRSRRQEQPVHVRRRHARILLRPAPPHLTRTREAAPALQACPYFLIFVEYDFVTVLPPDGRRQRQLQQLPDRRLPRHGSSARSRGTWRPRRPARPGPRSASCRRRRAGRLRPDGRLGRVGAAEHVAGDKRLAGARATLRDGDDRRRNRPNVFVTVAYDHTASPSGATSVARTWSPAYLLAST